MKQGKNPTRRQKKYIMHAGLSVDSWLVERVRPNELHLIHRYANQKKVIFI